ncbi:MAG: Uncharacterised protein [Synechococcus sp. CC9902]|nr:MAG: Uncharacterised protein [Synechococcus sp. CC9902]
MNAGRNGRDNVIAHLIAVATHGRTESHQQIFAPGSSCFKLIQRRRKDARRDTSPAGVARRGVSCCGIGDQNRRAIGAAHPKALAPTVADQTIRFWPRSTQGLARLEHKAAVNLLRPVNTRAHTDVTREFLRVPSSPESCEEAMLKALLSERVCLEVVTAVAADPGPAVQHVEQGVRTIEWVRPRLCRWGFAHNVAMSRIIQNPAKACSCGLA